MDRSPSCEKREASARDTAPGSAPTNRALGQRAVASKAAARCAPVRCRDRRDRRGSVADRSWRAGARRPARGRRAPSRHRRRRGPAPNSRGRSGAGRAALRQKPKKAAAIASRAHRHVLELGLARERVGRRLTSASMRAPAANGRSSASARRRRPAAGAVSALAHAGMAVPRCRAGRCRRRRCRARRRRRDGARRTARAMRAMSRGAAAGAGHGVPLVAHAAGVERHGIAGVDRHVAAAGAPHGDEAGPAVRR